MTTNEPLPSRYAGLLNALSDMQLSPAYAVRKQVLAQAERTIVELEREVTHWKANHDNQVAKARVLIERTDMPLERVAAYKQIGELQAEKQELWDRLQDTSTQYVDFMLGAHSKVCTERDNLQAQLAKEQAK